jgi:predicted AlkP superfamily phosphohydrolase/phosphomutase
MNQPKVAVIGLDCAEPGLVFDRWLDLLPNLKQLIQSGMYARMRSSDPPITVPAWASMVTGKNPGQLGFYGFRNRNSYDYLDVGLVDSSDLDEPTVWDILGKNGYRSIVIGVPPSYPPKPINGWLISCFLTPDRNSEYTYPQELKEEIEREVGEYMFDVTKFRTAEVETLLFELYQMAKMRFATARYLLQTKPWDFFMMVEMGIDRIHHAFWHYMDEKHVLYKETKWKNAILEYYQFIDQEIGKLVALLPEHTRILVVSDHGAKRMDGGFCINDWLRKEGYLHLKQPITSPTPFSPDLVDWKKTKAWGYGGYYGRICLNVKGREPQGIIPKNQYEKVRNELIKKLKLLTDEQGRWMNTKVFKPQKRYKTIKNIPPDLIVYFGNLYWRSVGSVGNQSVYVYENDTGPDGANHDYEGIFIHAQKGADPYGGTQLPRIHLMDVAPTILREYGIQPLKGMQGTAIALEKVR